VSVGAGSVPDTNPTRPAPEAQRWQSRSGATARDRRRRASTCPGSRPDQQDEDVGSSVVFPLPGSADQRRRKLVRTWTLRGTPYRGDRNTNTPPPRRFNRASQAPQPRRPTARPRPPALVRRPQGPRTGRTGRSRRAGKSPRRRERDRQPDGENLTEGGCVTRNKSHAPRDRRRGSRSAASPTPSAQPSTDAGHGVAVASSSAESATTCQARAPLTPS